VKKLPLYLLVLLSMVSYAYAGVFDTESIQYPQIQNIKLISFSADKETAVFEVEVYNPNDFKLPVRELSGDIYLNDQHVSNLEANSKKSLAPLSTQTFTVPIVVNSDAVMTSANDIMLTGIAEYRFKGYMMTPVGELPIAESGRLTADQILIFLQATLFADNRY
jgi:LEA14-like dessication related protein